LGHWPLDGLAGWAGHLVRGVTNTTTEEEERGGERGERERCRGERASHSWVVSLAVYTQLHGLLSSLWGWAIHSDICPPEACWLCLYMFLRLFCKMIIESYTSSLPKRLTKLITRLREWERKRVRRGEATLEFYEREERRREERERERAESDIYTYTYCLPTAPTRRRERESERDFLREREREQHVVHVCYIERVRVRSRVPHWESERKERLTIQGILGYPLILCPDKICHIYYYMMFIQRRREVHNLLPPIQRGGGGGNEVLRDERKISREAEIYIYMVPRLAVQGWLLYTQAFTHTHCHCPPTMSPTSFPQRRRERAGLPWYY